MLLVSAGLLLRSLQHVFAVEVGFDAANLLTMQVQESGRRFDTNWHTHWLRWVHTRSPASCH